MVTQLRVIRIAVSASDSERGNSTLRPSFITPGEDVRLYKRSEARTIGIVYHGRCAYCRGRIETGWLLFSSSCCLLGRSFVVVVLDVCNLYFSTKTFDVPMYNAGYINSGRKTTSKFSRLRCSFILQRIGFIES